jgi:hypothetical protein
MVTVLEATHTAIVPVTPMAAGACTVAGVDMASATDAPDRSLGAAVASAAVAWADSAEAMADLVAVTADTVDMLSKTIFSVDR